MVEIILQKFPFDKYGDNIFVDTSINFGGIEGRHLRRYNPPLTSDKGGIFIKKYVSLYR